MFDGGETNMASAPRSIGNPLMDVTPTMTERLQREKASLELKLSEVNLALKTIEANPQVQQVIDALTKLHWLR